MKEGNKFSEKEIASILVQLNQGTNADDLCRRYEISANTLDAWRVRYGGTEILLNRLKELEEENYRLKGKLADIEIQRDAKKTGDTDHIYRILASNIPGTAITILDREERYLLAEGDFLVTMGYEKETMPGKQIREVITPENYRYYEGIIQRAFAGETILVERLTISKFHTLMKVVPLKDGRGDIFAIMFVLIDISLVKQTQLDLAKINEELETKVLQRTEQLKEANRQLESFSYSVSHDLRAPLRSISGFTTILKEDYSPKVKEEEFDRLVNRVIANATRMERLINDLLNFSKLERQNISKSLIDMNKLVNEILNDLRSHERSRTLNIHISTLEPAYGDLSLIRQVWINLLSNALKYTNKKDVADITIGCSHVNGTICYNVSDNGAGFDMKYSDKLFGVFQRLHRVTDFEGTGVGLALCKSIVQRHGGKIWAEAEPGNGAKFLFTLPITPDNIVV
jgi:PAS domain S-box-containing protein